MKFTRAIKKQIRGLACGTLVAFTGGHLFISGLDEKEKLLLPEDHVHHEAPAERLPLGAFLTMTTSGTTSTVVTVTTTTTT